MTPLHIYSISVVRQCNLFYIVYIFPLIVMSHKSCVKKNYFKMLRMTLGGLIRRKIGQVEIFDHQAIIHLLISLTTLAGLFKEAVQYATRR